MKLTRACWLILAASAVSIPTTANAEDMRTCVECLFGDAAGRTLGFTPRGLSPWAGLALALHDPRPNQAAAHGSV